MAAELPKLPTKRRLFLDAYLGKARFNATEAARIAGYAHPNVEGTRLLADASVRAHRDEMLRNSGIDRDVALALVVAGATRSDTEIMEVAKSEDSEIVRSSLVSSLFNERTTHTTNLAKAYGLFTENINVTGGIDINIVGVDTEKL